MHQTPISKVKSTHRPPPHANSLLGLIPRDTSSPEPSVISTSQTSTVYQPSFFESLFNPPPSSSSKNPTLHQAQRVVTQMIQDMGERDDEIRTLKAALRQSRSHAVKAEIAMLETHAVNLEKELLLTRRDLEAKRRQLEDLGMVEEEGFVENVSFEEDDDEKGDGTLGDSIADGATATLHISPHAHDGDLFGDALESHYDHAQYQHDGYGDYSDDDAVVESNAASHQAYNDDTIVDQTMGSPLNRSVFGSIIDKQRTSSNYNPMREQELEQELEHEEMVQKEFDELKVLYQVQSDYDSNAMFCITKSQNNNCVVYKSNMSASGAINHMDPCSAYWIMFNQKPVNDRYPTEELNMIERNTAYGITCAEDEKNRPDHFSCSIASLSDRRFTIMRDGSKFIARTVINGNPNVALCQVHVQMADSWIPKVKHVDIFGLDLDTRDLVHERKIA